MKKIYLLAGLTALMLASCSTEEQSNDGYVASSKVTLNALLPNCGTRVSEAASDSYGLLTNWSDDDQLDVLVNTNAIVSMTKSTGNTFTASPADATQGAGFNAGNTIYGVNNNSSDSITTAVNGNQLKATVNFTGQNGTVDNLKKYDLMYGTGDPTSNITFNHQICILRLDINSNQLSADNIKSITGITLSYVPTSGTKFFATQEEYNFGATCDNKITDADYISLENTNISVSGGKATVYIAVPNRQNLFGTLNISMDGADGTSTFRYTLTNAISFSNALMLMSTVHPLAITNLSKNTAKVGDCLFSDGSWGAIADNVGKTPIAIIFSNKTSTLDQGHGWAHGYALALTDANTNCVWAGTGAATNPTGTNIKLIASAIISDKDGDTHTQSINSSLYPAAYAVATTYNSTVVPPLGTSGWYLPSVGQWYDVIKNLGNAGNYYDYGSLLWYTNYLNAANTYLAGKLNGITYTPFSTSKNSGYWSSSESSNTNVYVMVTDGSGYLNLDDYSKTGTTFAARGVIAF